MTETAGAPQNSSTGAGRDFLTRRKFAVAALSGVLASRLLPSAAVGAAALPTRRTLPDYRRTGDRSDSEALLRMIGSGIAHIHLPGGGGSARDGTYRIGMDAVRQGSGLPSGTRITGDGADTIVRPAAASQGCVFDVLASNAREPVRDIAFEDFAVIGWVAEDLFNEPTHLFRINGLRGAVFRNLSVSGFQGDGIYLGSGLRLGDERHNSLVEIANCRFDGLNGNNRNAISVIDCDSFTLTDCSARRVTRSGDGTGRIPQTPAERRNPRFGLGMPGALTFEPDRVGRFPVIRDVRVQGWSVEDCGGAAVALNLRENDSLDRPHSAIALTNIAATRCRIGIAGHGYSGDKALTQAVPYGIAVEGFAARDCAIPFQFDGLVDASLAGTANNCGTAMLGFAGGANRAITIRCDFRDCGKSDALNPGVALRIARSTRNLSLDSSSFSGCGSSRADQPTTLIYFTGGSHTGMSAKNLSARATVSSPSQRPRLIGVAGGGVDLSARSADVSVQSADWSLGADDFANMVARRGG
ncbi:right-handed parallel beta-helix repeat-containing protein [Allopontixanthobacter sp.]|uniref:right-handed parallel beta-helix repeat-containing protein n=1 Tax=Allopontixanthobacter sp. TaxID=2906452 RepID=UPI002ABADD1A|nr:right-handed parallel beta-helix repeat-containing protein [Allopontixanthobacter sp.]MDZ4307433.1 right-handed parallel beta-helix repeat-containing protein [Allopontixanthobacter sp.]